MSDIGKLRDGFRSNLMWCLAVAVPCVLGIPNIALSESVSNATRQSTISDATVIEIVKNITRVIDNNISPKLRPLFEVKPLLSSGILVEITFYTNEMPEVTSSELDSGIYRLNRSIDYGKYESVPGTLFKDANNMRIYYDVRSDVSDMIAQEIAKYYSSKVKSPQPIIQPSNILIITRSTLTNVNDQSIITNWVSDWIKPR